MFMLYFHRIKNAWNDSTTFGRVCLILFWFITIFIGLNNYWDKQK